MWYQTVLAATGATASPDVLDGINILPVLTGDVAAAADRHLVGTYQTRCDTVRSQRWKLRKVKRKLELYDLSTDPGEQHDVAKDHPEVVRELDAYRQKWTKTVRKAARPLHQVAGE